MNFNARSLIALGRIAFNMLDMVQRRQKGGRKARLKDEPMLVRTLTQGAMVLSTAAAAARAYYLLRPRKSGH